jgi:hypothetical protein
MFSSLMGRVFFVNNIVFQDERLYFSDPLALRHIFITDQSIFHETAVFIE